MIDPDGIVVGAVTGPTAISALASAGYDLETDWLPVRAELAAPGGRWVDLHPITFATDGSGLQPDGDGGKFLYPVGCFVSGLVGGRHVPCLSVEQQLIFHRGYEPREIDRLDLPLSESLLRLRKHEE